MPTLRTYLLLIGCGERHRLMLRPAAARWQACVPDLAGWVPAGDLEARRLGFGDLDAPRRACLLKLHAFSLVPDDAEAVLYADLDILPHPCFPSPALALQDVDFACVRDRWDDGHVCDVARAAGLESWQYFNAGLWLARRSARPMLEGAIPLFDRLKWWDQTGLNVSRVTHRTRTRWLPWRCNAMDHHDDGHWISASHAPHHAWPAWESGELPHWNAQVCMPDLLDQMDWSHGYTTDKRHVFELANLAIGRPRHVVEVGTFQGHATWAMAWSGAAVTTVDPENRTRRRWHGGLSADFLQGRGADLLAADPDLVCDMVFHDAEHGPHIIPELRQWWDRLLPAGILAVHDAEQLDGWRGDGLPGLAQVDWTADGKGRELMVIQKSKRAIPD